MVFAPSAFQAREWQHALFDMRRYTNLSDNERAVLLKYLQTRAKKLDEI